MDGAWHRVPVDGDKGHKRSGNYRGFLDGIPTGHIQNFKTGASVKWRADGHYESPQRPSHYAALAEERAAARLAREKAAATEASALWASGKAAEGHPYLKTKHVPSHGLRQVRGSLLVPMRDVTGGFWNVQQIGKDGTKIFQKDCRVSGCFHTVGDIRGASRVCITEGYATAAAVHRLSGAPTVCAFMAGNLLPVATAIRQRLPNAHIYLAGDHDHAVARELRRDGTPKVNVGKVKAEEAAAAVAGFCILPRFEEHETALSDWNDAVTAHGFNETRRRFALAVLIAEREQLKPKHTSVERSG